MMRPPDFSLTGISEVDSPPQLHPSQIIHGTSISKVNTCLILDKHMTVGLRAFLKEMNF